MSAASCQPTFGDLGHFVDWQGLRALLKGPKYGLNFSCPFMAGDGSNAGAIGPDEGDPDYAQELDGRVSVARRGTPIL